MTHDKAPQAPSVSRPARKHPAAELADLIDGKTVSEAVDGVFGYFMDLMEARDSLALGQLLDGLSTREAPVEVLLAPLAITCQWRENAQSRRSYFNAVAGELVRRDRRDIFELLAGLYRVRVPGAPLSRKARAARRAPHPLLLLGGDPDEQLEQETSEPPPAATELERWEAFVAMIGSSEDEFWQRYAGPFSELWSELVVQMGLLAPRPTVARLSDYDPDDEGLHVSWRKRSHYVELECRYRSEEGAILYEFWCYPQFQGMVPGDWDEPRRHPPIRELVAALLEHITSREP